MRIKWGAAADLEQNFKFHISTSSFITTCNYYSIVVWIQTQKTFFSGSFFPQPQNCKFMTFLSLIHSPLVIWIVFVQSKWRLDQRVIWEDHHHPFSPNNKLFWVNKKFFTCASTFLVLTTFLHNFFSHRIPLHMREKEENPFTFVRMLILYFLSYLLLANDEND